MLKRKVFHTDLFEQLQNKPIEAIGICQGTVLEVMVAGDIAEKAADVYACELNGSCPQHITCLAVVGDISAVDAAISSIEKSLLESC